MKAEPTTSSLLASGLLGAALLCVLIGERVVGDAALGHTVTGGAGLLLLVALGLRVRAFAAASGDVRAVEARLLASYGGVLASLLLYGLSTEAGLAALGREGEAAERASTLLSVLWPAVLLVSASALFFMELVYSRMPVAASVELRRVRTAAYAGLSLGFAAVFLLSINYVATARDVRKDVSYFKTTRPSGSTERMLDKLTAPVDVVLFWRKTDDVLQQVEPYFAALASHNPKLRYKVQDAALAPALARKHRVNGNGFVLLLSGAGDAQKGQSFRVGTELTEARAQLKKLDGSFQQAWNKLMRPERTVFVTVGHAERNSKAEDAKAGDGTQLVEQIWKRLNLKTTTLGPAQGLGNAVPDAASAVVMFGPREKLLPEETAALLAYVRKGGRLLCMLDPSKDDALDPLLEGLGVTRLPGTLISERQHMKRTFDASDKALVYSNSYSAHPVVTTASRYQSEVATIFVRGAGLQKAAATNLAPKPNVTFPLRSGTPFFRDLDDDFTRDPDEPEETANMVAAVTVSEKAGAPEGRAVFIGDGDFMTDKIAGNNGNAMLFVDSLAWLIGNEELAAEASSEEDVKLEHSQEQDKLWFYGTTFVMPMPVLALGLWVARRRRTRAEVAS